LAKRDNERKYKAHLSGRDKPDYTTENQLNFEELKDRLAKHVAELPEKCRIVFQLSREEGLSQKEIALRTGISEKTVEGHISRALQALRTNLQNFFTLFL
jgi:RNA polymerase sigma-70 factor (ECF subfamily)